MRTRLAVAVAAMLSGPACGRGIAELEAHAIAPATPATQGVRLTWLGTAGVRIDDGTTAILIDPFVSRPSLGAVAFGRRVTVDTAALAETVDDSRVDAVLVSHSHYDHLMDAPWLAKRAGADLIGSQSTVAVGRASGLPAGQVRVPALGESFRHGDFTVTLLASRHGAVLAGRVPYPGEIEPGPGLPMRARDYRMGGAFGIVIEHPQGTIIHHASASWVDGMYDGVQADVVLLGLAGHGDLESYVEHVVDATGAKRIIPIHWDNFFRPLDRPLRPLRSAHVPRFFRELQRPDLRVQTLPLLKPRVVFPNTPP